MKRYFILTIILIFSSSLFSQEKNQDITKLENYAKVEADLKEVYGDYFNKKIENNLEIIMSHIAIYNRCEFISVSEAPNAQNISELGLKDKYNPNAIKHDNFTEFNFEEFNIAKYFIDFYSDEDLYYRIYDTDKVLHIKKNR
ncbi:MAG: hypothetical protein WC994_03740 [Brumimicrobium sp.]